VGNRLHRMLPCTYHGPLPVAWPHEPEPHRGSLQGQLRPQSVVCLLSTVLSCAVAGRSAQLCCC
jgi:hypothetical protein